MSRLTKGKVCGREAWQWDDGPIFVVDEGMENAREWAVEYGKTVQRLETLKELANLSLEKAIKEEQIEELKKHESAQSGSTDN